MGLQQLPGRSERRQGNPIPEEFALLLHLDFAVDYHIRAGHGLYRILRQISQVRGCLRNETAPVFCMMPPTLGAGFQQSLSGENERKTPFAIMEKRSGNCVTKAKEGHLQWNTVWKRI